MLSYGQVLDGKYEILRQIGQGGTALVYLAMNQRLGQQWVIKEIDIRKNSKNIKKVMDEARLMKNFDHPFIPRVVDILEHGPFRYIVMDYVPGRSLSKNLKEHGPYPQDIVLQWAKQIGQVLEYLHSQQPPIIYHDLKPGNIILKEPENTIKLLDFGEARPLVNGDAPGGACTYKYAAPEQQVKTRGRTDQRTDIYCFGTTLYRLLTGKFAPDLPEEIGSIRKRFPELNISYGMDNIIRKCTDINPKNRFQSMSELNKALENLELWDANYLKRQSGKIRLCSSLFISGIVCSAVAFACLSFASNLDKKQYEALISTVNSSDYQVKSENYTKAIELNGTDPRAYNQLIDLFEENSFGTEQSSQLSHLLSQNITKMDETDTEILDLNYRIGRTYFNLFSGEQISFRDRVQKALPYFKTVMENSSPDYKNYNIASSYYILCQFFTDYVLNTNINTNEANKDAYEEMLKAVESCIIDMSDYDSIDAANTRLNFYEKLLDMINSNLRGMVQTKVPSSSVENIIDEIVNKASSESVTQDANIQLKNTIIQYGKTVLENYEREVNNTRNEGDS